MTLKELEAQFITYSKNAEGREVDTNVESISEAQGIIFLCPLCFAKNNGNVGTHSVSVSFANRNVPDDLGSHSRWTIMGGSGLDDLQLSPSISLDTSNCKWHGFIGNSGVPPGQAQ